MKVKQTIVATGRWPKEYAPQLSNRGDVEFFSAGDVFSLERFSPILKAFVQCVSTIEITLADGTGLVCKYEKIWE